MSGKIQHILMAVSISLCGCSPADQGKSSKQPAGAEHSPIIAQNAPEAPKRSEAKAGPFGIAFGESISELDAKPVPGKSTFFELASPPRPQADFPSVIVQAAPAVGVCWIKGLGNTFESDDFGVSARSRVDGIESVLETKYGKPGTLDYLMPGSLWTEPRYWLMGLKQGDRHYGYHWKRPATAPAQWSNISEIFLAVVSVGSEQRVDLEYYSPKGPDCDAAEKKAAAGAL